MRLHSRGRFSVKRLTRVASDRLWGTPFDRALRRAVRTRRRRFVFGWNRGLGDIALGLVPLFLRIRAAIPDARIEVFTRDDLAQGFALAGCDAVTVIPGLPRGQAIDLVSATAAAGRGLPPDAVAFADPDPTRWLDGRRTQYPPVLHWDATLDELADALVPAETGTITIGAHVNSETAAHYGYVKDWPAPNWQALFARFPRARGVRWLLFGHAREHAFAQDNVIDLRGRTDLLSLLAIVRTRCRILVAPDSGILTLAYYLEGERPLDLISLWSDPRQGIRKQGCPSPNRSLVHTIIQGRDEDVRNITVDDVARPIEAFLAARRRSPATAHAPDR